MGCPNVVPQNSEINQNNFAKLITWMGYWGPWVSKDLVSTVQDKNTDKIYLCGCCLFVGCGPKRNTVLKILKKHSILHYDENDGWRREGRQISSRALRDREHRLSNEIIVRHNYFRDLSLSSAVLAGPAARCCCTVRSRWRGALFARRGLYRTRTHAVHRERAQRSRRLPLVARSCELLCRSTWLCLVSRVLCHVQFHHGVRQWE